MRLRRPDGITVSSYPAGQAPERFTSGDFTLHRAAIPKDRGVRTTLLGRLIQAGERRRFGKTDFARWTHSALIVSDAGDIVEAIGRGVERDNIARYRDTDYLVVHVNAADGQRQLAGGFAATRVGDSYGVVNFIGLAFQALFGWRLAIHLDGQYICSGLVARATEKYVAAYPRSPEDMMPADLAYFWHAYSDEPPLPVGLFDRLLDLLARFVDLFRRHGGDPASDLGRVNDGQALSGGAAPAREAPSDLPARLEALIRRHERGQLSPADPGLDLHHAAHAAEDFPTEVREQAKEVLSTPAGISLQRRAFDVLENAALNGFGHAELIKSLRFLSQYPAKSYLYDVSALVARGERPSPAKLEALATDGFGATVNLCAETPAGDSANIATVSLRDSLRTCHVPIVDMTPPSRSQMIELLDWLTARGADHIRTYVHCEAGKGRTGVVIACYRIAVMGWSTESAIDEAKRFGCSVPAQLDFIEDFGAALIENWTARQDGNVSPRALGNYPLLVPRSVTPTAAQLAATLDSVARGAATGSTRPARNGRTAASGGVR